MLRFFALIMAAGAAIEAANGNIKDAVGGLAVAVMFLSIWALFGQRKDE